MKLLNNYKELPPLLKGTIIFTLLTLLSKGFAVISTPIFTRLMTKVDYGTYTLYNSWYNIFSVLCTFNITAGLYNSIVVKDPERIKSISSAVVGFEVLITTIMGGIYFVLTLFTTDVLGFSEAMGFLIFIENVFNIPILIWVAIQKFSNTYSKAFLVMFFEMFLNFAVCVLFVIFWKQKVYARIFGTIAVYVAFGLCLFVVIIKEGKVLFDKEIWKSLLLIGGPLALHHLGHSLFSQSDQIMIEYIWNDKAMVAVYGLAHSLSWLLGIINTGLKATLVPWKYKKIKAGNYSNISNLHLMVCVCLAVLTTLVVLLAPEILLIYGGQGYVEGATLVSILCTAVLIIYVYSLFVDIEIYYQKTIITMITTIVALGVNIGLNAWLIPKYASLGAAIATLISWFILLFVHTFTSSFVSKKNGLSIRKIYKVELFIAVVVLTTGINLLIPLLYDYLVLRIILAAVTMVAVMILAVVIFKKFKKSKAKDSIEG